MKRLFTILALLALLCAASVPAMAADSEPAEEVTAEETANENAVKIRKAWTSAGLIAVACLGGALGMARAISKATSNIAEQPEAAGQIRTSMMMGLVFIKTVIIYALIVAILIIFVL